MMIFRVQPLKSAPRTFKSTASWSSTIALTSPDASTTSDQDSPSPKPDWATDSRSPATKTSSTSSWPRTTRHSRRPDSPSQPRSSPRRMTSRSRSCSRSWRRFRISKSCPENCWSRTRKLHSLSPSGPMRPLNSCSQMNSELTKSASRWISRDLRCSSIGKLK